MFAQRKHLLMDRLLGSLVILGFFPCIVLGRQCAVEDCSVAYTTSLGRASIAEPESSETYCDILHAYQKCVRATANACRGNLLFHSYDLSIKTLDGRYCPHKGGAVAPKPAKSGAEQNASLATPSSPLPSCRYYGSNKFRHCGLFGDPHLKTFDAKYQTCRVQGQWNLIENPFMSVMVTNDVVVEDNSAFAPSKIVVIIKSSSTPCTLQKRYEAVSDAPLSKTFVDGTDRPGADETVSLKWKQYEKDNFETVEIYMKYIATKVLIRRIGKYLAFSARLPEEVIKSSATYNEEGKMELCTAGCPATELLSIQSVQKYMTSREQALDECKNRNVDNLEDEFKNNLTGSYLEWCVYDLLSAGSTSDFVALAHVAQSDALSMDPSSSPNGTDLRWLTESESGNSNNTANINVRTFILQIVISLVCSVVSLRWSI